MTSVKACVAVACALLLVLAASAMAQVTTTKPIKIEVPKPKKEKFKAEVLWMTRVAITVRSPANRNLVRTFTYTGKLAAKMGKLIDQNKPFQHGDPVEIEYLAGTDKALKIKGKPGQGG